MADNLPGEILEKIVMELEDIKAEPDAKIFSPALKIAVPITPTDPDEYVLGNEYTPTWITLTAAASKNIRNARTVSRNFKKAADRSFMKLVGQRPVSVSNVDLNMLRLVAQDTQASNWLHALTLNCGKLLQAKDENTTDEAGAYDAGVELAAVLVAFRNLCSVRMVAKYEPRNSTRFRLSETMGKYCEGIRRAGVKIDDLRFEPGFGLRQYFKALTPLDLSSLRIPRAEIGDSFLWKIDSMGSSPLASILTNASSLEDLSLSLSRSAMEIEGTERGEMRDLACLSHHLFQTLLKHTKLRRVHLMGGWVFNSKHLIGFLKKHATTIRSLLFERPSLDSGGPEAWASVLPEIATSTKGTLEYSFIHTLIYKSSRLGRFFWSANVKPEDFGQFDCVVEYWRNRKRMELLKPEDAHTKDEDTVDD